VDDLVDVYQTLDRMPGKQAAERGRRFNAFLADLLRRDGVDASSDQPGQDGWDEIDVHFTLGDTAYILEAKWTGKRVSWDPVSKLRDRLKNRPRGVRAVVVSMSGYTREALIQSRSFADVFLLDRSHVEALVSGLMTGPQLFYALWSVTSRRGGSYAPLRDLLVSGGSASNSMPMLCAPASFEDDFPILEEGGCRVTEVLTADGMWNAGDISGLAVAPDRFLLWTVPSGVLRVDPATGAASWTTAPPMCDGPVIAGPADSMTVSVRGAVVRMTGSRADVIGGGFRPGSRLIETADGTAWLFNNNGARIGMAGGRHHLVRLGTRLGEQTCYPVDFPGSIHQAVLTGAGALYLAAGGHSVTTNSEERWSCPEGKWVRSAPLTPAAALAVSQHTVLLAGATHRPGEGIEKAVLAVDTRDGTHKPLVRLPNTTHITALATADNGNAYLLTDIRGNSPEPRPHLLRLKLPPELP
jgi:hypothetical protein